MSLISQIQLRKIEHLIYFRFCSYSGGGGNEGGYYSHVDGHVSPWSPDYSTRPIGPAGLAAEGGPSGDTFACDNGANSKSCQYLDMREHEFGLEHIF